MKCMLRSLTLACAIVAVVCALNDIWIVAGMLMLIALFVQGAVVTMDEAELDEINRRGNNGH